jgi:acyl-CoA thioester hydrolase
MPHKNTEYFHYSYIRFVNLATQLELRIDWSEMDLFGHVNNVAFMKYVQAGRVNYWEQIGLTKMHEEEEKGPMLASTQCTFLKSLHYPGKIIIETSLEFIKTTSFGLQHRILTEKHELAAEAHDVVVMFDYSKRQKMEIPTSMRAAMEARQ